MTRKILQWSGRDNRGAVAPTVALSMFALVGMAGIAFDYARMASLDTELQNAADQAALAAATQLDGEDETCERAVEAARNLLVNQTIMGVPDATAGLAVTIEDTDVCQEDTSIVDNTDATIRFFQDKGGATPSDDDSNANYVEVKVDARRAVYALTPVVGAFSSGDLRAQARAGLSTALCKVPPLMVCPPSGGVADWDALRGHGIIAVSNTGSTWAPGAFGYLGPNDANSKQIGLAFENPVFQCQGITGTENVSTGQPAPAITALNTRFDIYDFGSGAGTALSPCLGTACPPAVNVTKDLIRAGNASGNNACKIHSSGWKLPASNQRFRPVARAGTDPMRHFQTTGQTIAAMGLPRDNCHYTSYGTACAGGRFGDGVWARGDYFDKYHPSVRPSNAGTMTRYEAYRWEIDNASIPNDTPNNTAAAGQRGTAVCNATVPDSSRDRRVIQVAVASNCAALRGSSVDAVISNWVDMFLVEPGVASPGRGNGDGGNEAYLEVIGESAPGGAHPQVVRRDVPYLVR